MVIWLTDPTVSEIAADAGLDFTWMTLQSVNGRDTTFLNGNYPDCSNRCVCMNHASAVLDGFTIMNAYYTNVSSGINGGGMLIYRGTVRNCNITSNVGERGGGAHVAGAAFMYNCNITNEPAFANYAAGDYRLSHTSPCINAGTNQAWMIGAVDMDGHQRIDKHYGLRVDMGAYEFIPRGTIFIGH